MKECFILRAVPGGGKSSVAESISGEDGVIFESDKYMYDSEGNYNFTWKKLGWAHGQCYKDFKEACVNGVERIIVSNTNTTYSEFGKYKKWAEKQGYRVYVLIVENRHGNSNVHDVPDDTLAKMEARLRKDIKLV